MPRKSGHWICINVWGYVDLASCLNNSFVTLSHLCLSGYMIYLQSTFWFWVKQGKAVEWKFKTNRTWLNRGKSYLIKVSNKYWLYLSGFVLTFSGAYMVLDIRKLGFLQEYLSVSADLNRQLDNRECVFIESDAFGIETFSIYFFIPWFGFWFFVDLSDGVFKDSPFLYCFVQVRGH